MTKEIVLKMEPEDDDYPFSERYHKMLFDLRVNEWQPFIEIAINAAIRWLSVHPEIQRTVTGFAVAPDGVLLVGPTWRHIVIWSELREFVGAPPGSPKS